MQNVIKTSRLNVLKKLGKSQDIIVLLKRDKRNGMVILDRVDWINNVSLFVFYSEIWSIIFNIFQ